MTPETSVGRLRSPGVPCDSRLPRLRRISSKGWLSYAVAGAHCRASSCCEHPLKRQDRQTAVAEAFRVVADHKQAKIVVRKVADDLGLV
jgi:hypothetical protein